MPRFPSVTTISLSNSPLPYLRFPKIYLGFPPPPRPPSPPEKKFSMRTVFTSLGTTKIPRINEKQRLCKFFPNCNIHGLHSLRDRSLFMARRGGGFGGGITWFLGEQKGGSVVTENPKGGINENFGRIQRGDHSNLLGKWRHGGGGSRESSNAIRGDHFSEVTFKGGIG